MKANELRLGNLILHGDRLSSVLELKQDGAIVQILDQVAIEFRSTNLNPIPLTEEWMLRLGFTKRYQEVGHGINDIIDNFELDGFRFSEDIYGKWYLCGYNWNTERFKYVHQLQNLYFALSGEEVTIKELA